MNFATRTYNPHPLWRSTIGFDRLFDPLDETQHRTQNPYPPYNIERLGCDRSHLSHPLGVFKPDDIAGDRPAERTDLEGRNGDKDEYEYLYQGISALPSSGSSTLPITWQGWKTALFYTHLLIFF